MLLRAATESDISQIYEIETTTQQSPWSRDTFERCFQAKCLGWVVEQPADKIIGFILVYIQVGECHILNLCVDPAYQRKGFATQLISKALAASKDQNATIAYLEVRKSNEHAIKLYEKIGFTKIGERKDYYPAALGREDAWLFVTHL